MHMISKSYLVGYGVYAEKLWWQKSHGAKKIQECSANAIACAHKLFLPQVSAANIDGMLHLDSIPRVKVFCLYHD